MQRLLASAFVVAAALPGCETARDAASSAAYELNPFGATDLSVQALSLHGPYLLAVVAGRDERMRLLAPVSDVCVRVLQPEARVRYAKSGAFGRIGRDGEACDAAGVASLEQWRDRQPRQRIESVVPRATARWEPLFRDERWIFVRGRFPLASKIGIAAGYDLVAMLPADAACSAAAERREATLEFRQAGRTPYRLLVGERSCPVEGFALPVTR
ncbi:MAG: hypothetical protein DCC71_15490 [Proteobacteria bacterium]|nr:MAG: hypothetical protein DCC71_15490 [Pseudomonadota bacterium]